MIGIIGATGWLGSALGKGLLESGFPSDQLILANRTGPRGDYHGRTGVLWATPAELAEQAEVIVISVRPEDWPALDLRAEGRLVISFMAGIPLAAMACGGRIVRAMPNGAAENGRSYTPWVAGAGVTDADRQIVGRVLSAMGTAEEVESEAQLDLMAAVSGSGAAYPALMAQAAFDFLRTRGVAEATAWRAVEAMVCDGSALLAGQIERSADYLAAYRDYRGVTAAGLDAAEGAGFPRAVAAALTAAAEKAARF